MLTFTGYLIEVNNRILSIDTERALQGVCKYLNESKIKYMTYEEFEGNDNRV